ncbi:hypothetical protein Poly30_18430 [Planctomycetes bacterium Poly30]|uniref:O-Antigen ligase n=1 Tax=Saltatorellus ferox TaxID=2528018 RepID=A0A518EQG1_9BACT|nr:hypothetical protein Poly30_18430 [Planctomycetes bacterium Poly30]
MISATLALADAYVREGFGTREFFNQTTVHPLGLAVLGVLGLATCLVHRRYLLLPLLALACVVPQGQRIVIAGLDFNFVRLLLLVGIARVVAFSEWTHIRPKALDRIVVAWTLIGAIGYVLQVGEFSAVIYRLGLGFDILGMYFMCRVAFRDWRDVDIAVTGFAVMACFSFFFFMVEKLTGRNPFSIMGGVPEFTGMREGKLRTQGPFVHAILAGCFWALLLPIVAAKVLSKRRSQRMLGLFGSLAILSIVLFCASSTPLIVLGCNGLGAIIYRYRRHMRLIRWTTGLGLLALHLYMKQPVWHLIARIDVVGGSTGWHRYKLIQSAIDNFHEWWLCGIPSTAHWGYFMFDVTNQYVLEGVRAGIVAVIAFVWVLVYAFKHVGETWPTVRRNDYLCLLSWAFGVSIFAHVNVFLAVSISHSAQSLLALLFVLAAIASMAPDPVAQPLGEWLRPRRMRLLRARVAAARASMERASSRDPLGTA